MSEKIRLGFAICGSFCTFDEAVAQMERLAVLGYDLVPIMSEISYETDTRFGRASDFIDRIEKICGKSVIHTVSEAEPIGPKKMLDALLIMPCTGNTLAKLQYGITDTSVTMASKAHLRNARPLIIAVSTNDALSTAAVNIGGLLSRKNVYFVPFSQDDPKNKPRSMVAEFEKVPAAVAAALSGEQLQPIVC